MVQGKTSQAIIQLERAVALDPDLFEAFGNLAQAYLATGQDVKAVQAAYRALELRETTPGKTAVCSLRAQCGVQVGQRWPGAEIDVACAVGRLGAAPRRLRAHSSVSSSLAPASTIASRASIRLGRRSCRLANCSICRGWRNCQAICCFAACSNASPITDIGLERLLTNVRHAMLTLCHECRVNGTRAYSSFSARWHGSAFSTNISTPLTESEAAQAIELKAALGDKINAGDHGSGAVARDGRRLFSAACLD